MPQHARRGWALGYAAALVAFAFAFAGCAGPRSYTDADGREQRLGAGSGAAAAAASGAKPSALASPRPADPSETATGTAVPRRSGPVPSAESLIGAAPAEVTDGLGLPRLVRKEGRTQLWQYRTLDCVLDVFIGEDERRQSRVMRLEARDRRGAAMNGAAGVAGCVDQVAARAVAPTS